MDKEISWSWLGIKELVGNFAPAYILLLVVLYLFDKLGDLASVIYLMFIAGLIAVAMSAIQPYILNFILRPTKYLRELTDSSLKEVREEEKKSRKLRIDIEQTTENFNKAYLPALKISLEKFWEKREKLTGFDKKFYEIKEGKLFLYFYLGLLFFGITLIRIYEILFNKIVFIKIVQISQDFPFFNNYSGAIFLILGAVFIFGCAYEITRYKDIINEEIPVIAATKEKNDINYVKQKIAFLEKRKKFLKSNVYSELKSGYEKEYERLQKINFEKDFLQNKVKKETKISMTEIQAIFDKVGTKTSYPFRTPFNLIFIIVMIITTLLTAVVTFLPLTKIINDLLIEPYFVILMITALSISSALIFKLLRILT